MAEANGATQPSLLMQAYKAVASLVPASAQQGDDEFFMFIPDTDLKVLVARTIGVSENTSKGLLTQLRDAGIYRSESSGRGKPWKRFVKLNAEATVAFAAASNSTRQQRKSTPSPSPPPAPSPEPEGVEATPDQLNELFQQLAARLDEYAAANADLMRQLDEEKRAHAATKAELDEEKARVPTFVIPQDVAKHLKMD